MDINFLPKGFIIGFLVAVYPGPICVLCIRRTLAEGRAFGLTSGLGAATADALYGSIAGFGLTFISDALVDQQTWFRLVGGVFLCYLGVKAFLARPAERAASVRGNGPIGAYASTLFLTLTNPTTILSFAAIFAGFGIMSAGGNYISAGILVLGVFTGSALWWLILSSLVGLARTKFSTRWLRWVNRISGTVLVGFGIRFALLSLIGLFYDSGWA